MTWETVRLGDVAEQIRGVTYSKGEAIDTPTSGYVALVRAGNIGEAGLHMDDLIHVPATRVSPRQWLRVDDVVVASSSGSLSVVGKAARVVGSIDATFGAFCKVLRPFSGIDAGYFAHYFRTAEYRRYISSVAAGANINNLRNEDLDRIEIPLPPLPEQRRIAAILDEADALRVRASSQALALDELDDGMFEELLGSQVAQREWTLEDVLEDLRYGTSVKSGNTGVPVLRIPNVSGRAMNVLDLKTVDLSPAEVERLRLIDRDVLFVRSNGNPDVVGRCSAFSSIARVSRHSASWVFASYLIRGRLREGVEPEAIVALTRSPHGRRHLRSGAATSAGQYNINTSVLRTMPVFDPSSSKQRDYADFVRSTADERRRIRGRARELDELFASLQHRAFRGEL